MVTLSLPLVMTFGNGDRATINRASVSPVAQRSGDTGTPDLASRFVLAPLRAIREAAIEANEKPPETVARTLEALPALMGLK